MNFEHYCIKSSRCTFLQFIIIFFKFVDQNKIFIFYDNWYRRAKSTSKVNKDKCGVPYNYPVLLCDACTIDTAVNKAEAESISTADVSQFVRTMVRI